MVDSSSLAPMRAAATLLCTVAVGAVAGCGGGDKGTDDKAQIRQTVDDYAAALSGRHASRLCDVLITPKLLAQSKDKRSAQFARCHKRIAGQKLSGLPPAQKVDVGRVDVSGSKATAQVSTSAGGKRQSHKIAFRKVDGRWRILAGS
jgi:ketosteroid isomerase-like protein